MIYEIDYSNKYFPKNIRELGTIYECKNSNFKINTVESLEKYFNKLKK